jgi:predicted ester cyclase
MKRAEQEARNKSVIEEYYRNIDNEDLYKVFKMVEKLIDKDYVCHFATHELEGIDSLKDHLISSNEAFRNASHNIESIMAEGDMVATRCVFKAVHKGEFLGIPPSGKLISVPVICLNRVVDGRIKETWADWDSFYQLKQKFEAISTFKELHYE